MLKKLVLYTGIYVLISFVMSADEIACALEGEELCWVNLLGKWVVFLFLMWLFDAYIRPLIFKR